MKNNNSVIISTFLTNFIAYWDYRGICHQSNSHYYETQWEWNQTLSTKINQISAKIYEKSRKSGIKTIQVPNKYRSLLESLDYYSNGNNDQNFDATLSGRYNIKYVDDGNDIIIDSVGILKILGFE